MGACFEALNLTFPWHPRILPEILLDSKPLDWVNVRFNLPVNQNSPMTELYIKDEIKTCMHPFDPSYKSKADLQGRPLPPPPLRMLMELLSERTLQSREVEAKSAPSPLICRP